MSMRSQYTYALSNDCFNLTDYATYENLGFSGVSAYNADNSGYIDNTNNDRTNYIRNNGIAVQHNIVISYPRCLTSKVRGLNNRNVKYFQIQYPQYAFEWCEERTRIPFVAVLMACNMCYNKRYDYLGLLVERRQSCNYFGWN